MSGWHSFEERDLKAELGRYGRVDVEGLDGGKKGYGTFR